MEDSKLVLEEILEKILPAIAPLNEQVYDNEVRRTWKKLTEHHCVEVIPFKLHGSLGSIVFDKGPDKATSTKLYNIRFNLFSTLRQMSEGILATAALDSGVLLFITLILQTIRIIKNALSVDLTENTSQVLYVVFHTTLIEGNTLTKRNLHRIINSSLKQLNRDPISPNEIDRQIKKLQHLGCIGKDVDEGSFRIMESVIVRFNARINK